MPDYHRRNGRLGGLQTALRHGSDHYRKMGKIGGRHRKPTLDELKAMTAPEEITKEEILSAALPRLKVLYRIKQGDGAICPRKGV